MSGAAGDRDERVGSAGGFTLVEVMVALVILATGALAVTQLSLSVAVLMQQSTAKTELIAHAENKLEEVQARDFDELVAGTEADTVSVRGRPYVRRITIAAPNTRTREIRVELDSEGETLRYNALTYVSAP